MCCYIENSVTVNLYFSFISLLVPGSISKKNKLSWTLCANFTHRTLLDTTSWNERRHVDELSPCLHSCVCYTEPKQPSAVKFWNEEKGWQCATDHLVSPSGILKLDWFQDMEMWLIKKCFEKKKFSKSLYMILFTHIVWTLGLGLAKNRVVVAPPPPLKFSFIVLP